MNLTNKTIHWGPTCLRMIIIAGTYNKPAFSATITTQTVAILDKNIKSGPMWFGEKLYQSESLLSACFVSCFWSNFTWIHLQCRFPWCKFHAKRKERLTAMYTACRFTHVGSPLDCRLHNPTYSYFTKQFWSRKAAWSR